MTFHETVPPVGTRCADDRCGQSIGQGHPRTGWIRVFVAGSHDSAVWYSSPECLVYALGVRPGMVRRAAFIWPDDQRHGFTVPEAINLVNRYSGYTLTRLGLTVIRVRYAHRLALAAVEPEHPEFEVIRLALASARSVLLGDCGEVDESPADLEADGADDIDEAIGY